MTEETEEWVAVAVTTELSAGSTCTASVHESDLQTYKVRVEGESLTSTSETSNLKRCMDGPLWC
jgi:hypothetical protein